MLFTNVGVDVREIFELILKQQHVTVWVCGLDSSGSGYGLLAGYYEHGNYPLGSLYVSGFLYRLMTVILSSPLIHAVNM
jgi:hypothetical protein